ncbi:hypothetical protein ACOJTA_08270 [Malaciobacter sp. WC5094]
MQKVILLATSHDIQHGKRLNPEYINHIKSLIEKYDIKSISEEINDDKEYLTEKFCKENSISYKIIEPNDTVEKPALGIKTLKEIDIDMLNKYVVPDNPAESPRLESWPNPANEETLPSDI